MIVVLWVVKLCDLVGDYQCLGGKHHLHIQSSTSAMSQLMGVFSFNVLSFLALCLQDLPLLNMSRRLDLFMFNGYYRSSKAMKVY